MTIRPSIIDTIVHGEDEARRLAAERALAEQAKSLKVQERQNERLLREQRQLRDTQTRAAREAATQAEDATRRLAAREAGARASQARVEAHAAATADNTRRLLKIERERERRARPADPDLARYWPHPVAPGVILTVGQVEDFLEQQRLAREAERAEDDRTRRARPGTELEHLQRGYAYDPNSPQSIGWLEDQDRRGTRWLQDMRQTAQRAEAALAAARAMRRRDWYALPLPVLAATVSTLFTLADWRVAVIVGIVTVFVLAPYRSLGGIRQAAAPQRARAYRFLTYGGLAFTQAVLGGEQLIGAQWALVGVTLVGGVVWAVRHWRQHTAAVQTAAKALADAQAQLDGHARRQADRQRRVTEYRERQAAITSTMPNAISSDATDAASAAPSATTPAAAPADPASSGGEGTADTPAVPPTRGRLGTIG